MSTLTATPGAGPSRPAAGNGATTDFMCDEAHARISFLERPPRGSGTAHNGFTDDARMAPSQAPANTALSLSTRIQWLIRTEGSASAIARSCGVSEGTVRNWRDGHSDMSRERCVTLAQALGISLLWLVAGEGTMRVEPPAAATTATLAAPSVQADTVEARLQAGTPAVDPRRLASALRLLQSYIGLAGGSLDPSQRADVLVELYELLGCAGEPGHAERLIAFHATLGDLLRGNRRALIA
jgi:hypothetical protein